MSVPEVIPNPDATRLMNQRAWKALQLALLMGLTGGAAGRAGAGIFGNISRNIRRKREEKAEEKPVGEFTLGTKTAEEPRPRWFWPGLMLGTPAAVYGGWAGTSRLLKAYRKRRVRQDLEQAKKEFEDAMASEQQLKFSADLTTLADAWVSGELDEDLEKSAQVGTMLKALGPGAYTAMSLLGLLGLGAGWKLMGENPEEERIRAYREAARRRRMSRPLSLTARPAEDTAKLVAHSKATSTTPQHDASTSPEAREPNDYEGERKTAQLAGGLRLLRRGALPMAAGAAGVGLGAKGLYGTETGRNYVRRQTIQSLKDAPAEAAKGLWSGAKGYLSQNPAMRNALITGALGAVGGGLSGMRSGESPWRRALIGMILAALMGYGGTRLWQHPGVQRRVQGWRRSM
jgi:hypothetical protein